jgi:hypothetical protein
VSQISHYDINSDFL